MKQVSVTINLYTIYELSENAKEKAINEHGDFLQSIGSEYEAENGDMVTDYSRPTEAEILDSIEANEYLYFEDGEMAHTIHYCGKHEKSGTTEFNFMGNTYDITK